MRTAILGAGLLLWTGALHAAEMNIDHCRFPQAPTVPDGATASEQAMGQAGTDVREFVAGIQNSLQCLTELEQSLGDEITEAQKDQFVAIYNDGVDQMNAVANAYNAAVRAYKAR